MYKRIPKAQKGLAKIAKSMKVAKKISNTAKKGAPAIVRKAKGVKSAQKALSQSGLSGVKPAQLRAQFNELLKQASTLSKKKASTKKLALKQKGGTVGKGKKTTYKSLVKDIGGKPKKMKPFVGKRTISEKAAKRKVAKGKGKISYRVGGDDPGPGVYNKYAKKKTMNRLTRTKTRRLKGKGRTIRKKS